MICYIHASMDVTFASGWTTPCGSAGVLACEFGRRLAARIPDGEIKAVQADQPASL